MAEELTSVTVEILRQIRDELRTTNQGLSSLEARVEQGFKELKAETQKTNERLERVEVALVSMSRVNDGLPPLGR